MASICFIAIRKRRNVFTYLTSFVDKDAKTIFTNVATSTCIMAPKPHKVASFFLEKALTLFKSTDAGQENNEIYIAYPPLLQDFYNNTKEPKLKLNNYSYNFSQDLNAINSAKYPEWAKINQRLKDIQCQFFVTTKDGQPTKSYSSPFPQDSAKIISIIAKHSQAFFDLLDKGADTKLAHNDFIHTLYNTNLFQYIDTKPLPVTTSATETLNLDIIHSNPLIPGKHDAIPTLIQCRYLYSTNNATGAVTPLFPANKQTTKIINQRRYYNQQENFDKVKDSSVAFLTKFIAQNPAVMEHISAIKINFLMNTDPRLTISLQPHEIANTPGNKTLIKLLEYKRQKCNQIHQAYREACIQDAQAFNKFAGNNSASYLKQNYAFAGYGNYCIARYKKHSTITEPDSTSNTLLQSTKKIALAQIKTAMLKTINSLTLENLTQKPQNEFEGKLIALAKEAMPDTIKQLLYNELAKKHIEEQQELEKRQNQEKDLIVQKIQTLSV